MMEALKRWSNPPRPVIVGPLDAVDRVREPPAHRQGRR